MKANKTLQVLYKSWKTTIADLLHRNLHKFWAAALLIFKIRYPFHQIQCVFMKTFHKQVPFFTNFGPCLLDFLVSTDLFSLSNTSFASSSLSELLSDVFQPLSLLAFNSLLIFWSSSLKFGSLLTKAVFAIDNS